MRDEIWSNMHHLSALSFSQQQTPKNSLLKSLRDREREKWKEKGKREERGREKEREREDGDLPLPVSSGFEPPLGVVRQHFTHTNTYFQHTHPLAHTDTTQTNLYSKLTVTQVTAHLPSTSSPKFTQNFFFFKRLYM